MKKFVFLYGTQKCGTTWLARNLNSSSHVYQAGIKEWRFFPWYFSSPRKLNYIDTGKKIKDDLRYTMRLEPDEFLQNQARIVHTDPTMSVLADFTPSLGSLLTTENFRDLADLFRSFQLEARGMMFMRDPVERSVSQLSMLIENAKLLSNPRLQKWALTRFNCPEAEAFDRLVDQNLKKLTFRSRYDEVLEKISALDADIPSLVMTTDDLFSTGGLDIVTGFLEIPKVTVDPDPGNARKHVSISLETRRKIARSLEPTYRYMEHYFGAKGFPKSWLPSLKFLE